MQTNLMKWLLLFSLVPVLDGSQMPWKVDKFTTLERTVTTILELCHENDKSSDPIVIFGFNEIIDGSSVIPLNNSLDNSDDRWLNFKASEVVLVEDTPTQLVLDLMLLSKVEWWDHMTPFFILAKYTEKCENFTEILYTTWTMDVINSIYICAESLDNSVLYTLNLMADYAPHPWEKMEEMKNLNVFRQVFDPGLLCRNLNFDRTRILNGYGIQIDMENSFSLPEEETILKPDDTQAFNMKILQLLMIASNTMIARNGREIEMNFHGITTTENWGPDIFLVCSSIQQCYRRLSCLYPHMRIARISVVKLKPEITTLEKILKLWSTPVLIAAAISLIFLIHILTLKDHDLVSPILNVSKIASFLTKRERGSAVESIHEAVDLGYEMFSDQGDVALLNEQCSKCKVKEIELQRCVKQMSDNTNYLCIMWEVVYHSELSHLNFDYIPKTVNEFSMAYECRKHWPLRNHFSYMLLRLVQSDIVEFEWQKMMIEPKRKRAAKEAEWASAQYRPVKL